MDPLKGNALLEIDPDITFSIIDRIMGGTGETPGYQHELTDIESSAIEGIIIRLMMNLREAWGQIIDLRPRLCKIETNPHFAQVVPPTDMVLLVTLEVKIGDVEGMINFCIPYKTIEPIVHKLLPKYWHNTNKREESKIVNNSLLSGVTIPLRAELFRNVVTVKYLSELKVGDIIESAEQTNGNLLCENIVVGKFKLNPFTFAIEVTEKLLYKENFMETKHNVSESGVTLGDIKIQIIAELGRTYSTLDKVRNFEVGAIIELDKHAGAPVDIFANNVKVAHGEVAIFENEYFGVHITEIICSDTVNKESLPIAL
jgi:flagellar motor switch protein FliN